MDSSMRLAPSLAATLILSSAAWSCSQPAPNADRSDLHTIRTQPIVGGTIDDDPAHDAVVMIYASEAGAMCTGSVISQPGERGVVLTARHCVSHVVSEYVTCVNDVSDDFSPESIGVAKGVDPSYSGAAIIGNGEKIFHTPGTSLCNADFAVVVLDSPIVGIKPLRVRIDPTSYAVGEMFTAIGYGLTNPNAGQSAGTRHLRGSVKVTRLGPWAGVVDDKEFIGTSSICSGDSGGPAVSAAWAVIGVTSRGADCYSDDNLWTRVDGFKATLDEAMAYARSSYVAEDGTVQGKGEIMDTGSQSGHGQGPNDSANPDAQVGNGTWEASCGDLGPCPRGTFCIASGGKATCSAVCNANVPCPEGSTCDLPSGVCRETSPSEQAASAGQSTGGCRLAVGRSRSRDGLALIAIAAIALTARRRRSSARA